MKKTSTYIFILLMLILLASTQDFFPSKTYDAPLLNSLGSVSRSSSHEPIIIDGNTDFVSQATTEGWQGNGSQTNPFLIADFIFQSVNGSGIIIRNVDAHFSITNCTFIKDYSGLIGIVLINVSSGKISLNTFNLGRYSEAGTGISVTDSDTLNIDHNTLINGSIGVKITNSYNISATENFFIEYEVAGLNISNSSTLIIRANYFGGEYPKEAIVSGESSNLLIADNYMNCYGGIFLQDSTETTIRNNTLIIKVFFVDMGIQLVNSSNNLISNNSIYEASWGIFLEESSHNNTITKNLMVDCGSAGMTWGEGIYIHESTNNLVENNVIQDSLKHGIWLRNAPQNDIRDNQLINDELIITGETLENHKQKAVVNNTINGKPILFWVDVSDETVPVGAGQIILSYCHEISILDQTLEVIHLAHCTDINVANNSITLTSWFGFFLQQSSMVTITSNIITGNSETSHGIYMDNCFQVLVQNNSINSNSNGVYLYACSQISFLKNVFYNNSNGVFISSDTSNCELDQNIFFENGWAIDICHRTSINIVVTHNLFIDNIADEEKEGQSQVADAGSNNIFAANYWSDWVEPDTNDDGIVDNPYPIHSGDSYPLQQTNQDPIPLVSPENGSTHDYIFPPQITFPGAREVLEGQITITWNPAVDVQNHPVSYTVSYSPDLGESWIVIKANIETTYLTWDVSLLPTGSNYLLKVVASCSEGKSAMDISNEPFYIIGVITSSKTSSVSIPRTKNPIPAPSFSFLLLCITLLVALKRRN